MPLEFDTYLSPYTWRYGSTEMRQVWSEEHKRLLWRRIWTALAQVEAEFGLVTGAQLAAVQRALPDVDVARSLEIEAEIHHDLMAELKAFAEKSQEGGGILHLGATSADIEDNADALRIRESLTLVVERLERLLAEFARKIEAWADLPVIAYTHLQPAEPTTLGYRMALYAQDLLADLERLELLILGLRGKGLRGAVGTGASFGELIGVAQLADFENRLSAQLDLKFFPLASQVYPRRQDYEVVSALAAVGATLSKFGYDLRIMQSPAIGEWSEPFGSRQVGSSAMPFKRNPIQAEKLDSLARHLAQLPRIAWDNAAHSLLERTLDDSANRRIFLPEAFLCLDEMLLTALRILGGLQIDPGRIQKNLEEYGLFAGIERVLMRLGKAGADRQAMHEILRRHALDAWNELKAGRANPLRLRISEDPVLQAYLSADELRLLLDVQAYLGDAPQRARKFAGELKNRLSAS